MARYIPTRARLAGLGLVIAAVTIIALAIVVLVDLDRELKVHTEVIAAQRAKDQLHGLRSHLLELRSTARLGARTGDASAFRKIEMAARMSSRARGCRGGPVGHDAVVPPVPVERLRQCRALGRRCARARALGSGAARDREPHEGGDRAATLAALQTAR